MTYEKPNKTYVLRKLLNAMATTHQREKKRMQKEINDLKSELGILRRNIEHLPPEKRTTFEAREAEIQRRIKVQRGVKWNLI